MVTTRITWQSYLLVQLNDIVEEMVVTYHRIPHGPLLDVAPWLPALLVKDPPLEKFHKRLDDFPPTIVQGELSRDSGGPDCVAKVEVIEGLSGIVAVIQTSTFDNLPNGGVVSKANTVEAMVDEGPPGDRSREAGVVFIHPIGLDEVGATTEQDVMDIVGG